MPQQRPRIAVFSGATATIMNSAPLVTSNQARARHGLPLVSDGGAHRCASTRCGRSGLPRR